MAVTTEDIQEAAKMLWAASSTLSHPSTGLVKSLIMGRVQDAPTAPYTSFTVKDGPIQRTQTGGYLQTFTVELKTWSEAGAASAGPIKLAIDAAFIKLTRTVLTLPSLRTLAILHSVKAPGGLDEDNATKQGQAVKISTDRYEFLCQG